MKFLTAARGKTRWNLPRFWEKIWSDDGGGTGWFMDAPISEEIREIAWKNVDYCGHCGGVCDGGTRKIIFGKEFDGVCNTAFRFDNPKAEAVKCVEKLMEIIKNG